MLLTHVCLYVRNYAPTYIHVNKCLENKQKEKKIVLMNCIWGTHMYAPRYDIHMNKKACESLNIHPAVEQCSTTNSKSIIDTLK